MLGKLIKYEWKACARACLPIYGAVILVAIVNRLLSVLRISDVMGTAPTVVAGFVYFGVLVAVFVVTTVILIQRFYKSLLGDEGYLMFTLPVTAGQHIMAKTIVAFVLSVLSGIAAIISAGILAVGGDFFMQTGFFFNEIFRAFGQEPNNILYCIELFIWLVVGGMGAILMVYLCIAIGHLAKRRRVAVAVVAYFVLTTALQILAVMFFTTTDSLNLFGFLNTMPDSVAGHVIMLLMIVGTGIFTAAFFFGTRQILTKKLNLE